MRAKERPPLVQRLSLTVQGDRVRRGYAGLLRPGNLREDVRSTVR
jgi:hypothetical protein